MTFRAYQEGAQETKTTVLDGGTRVYWEPADEIKVFFKSSSGRFVSQNTGLARVADFSGVLNILVGANEGEDAANQTWGLYPFRSDASFDGEYVTTTLPAEQTGRAGSFAKNTHICLAKSGGNDLTFYNVTGGLRFSLSNEGIKSVSFEGANGEAVAGTVKLSFEDGIPVVKEIIEPKTVITLTAPDNGTFQTGKWYYLEVIPGNINGFKITFVSVSGHAIRKTSNLVTVRRGVYGNLPDIDAGCPVFDEPEAVDLGLPSGTLWASMNVGAISPEDIGGRYAWGETLTKSYYDWDNYKWCNGSYSSLTKYCNTSSYGTVDNKLTLENDDDVAQVLLGNEWHMPNNNQMQELIDKCKWRDEVLNGVTGCRVTGPNSNSIFIPCNGQYDEGGLVHNSEVFLWTSETDGSYNAYRCEYYGKANLKCWNHRHDGLCIRPVKGHSPQTSVVPDAIDLGLSVKWASFNVGATKPEESGDYFAWGETEPKNKYSWSTYKWCLGQSTTPDAEDLTKYNTNPDYGEVDNLTILQPEDDAATAAFGKDWRMPTFAEIRELVNGCSWTYTQQNGVTGFIVTSNVEGFKNKSIFLPAAGYRLEDGLYQVGIDGNYASSTLYTDDPDNGLGLAFWSSTVMYRSSYDGRRYGRSVRAVTKE